MPLAHWALSLAAFGPLFAAWPGLASPYALPKLLFLALAAALDRGARADWSYRPLLETRMTVATLRGDARVKADTAARLARLDALRR